MVLDKSEKPPLLDRCCSAGRLAGTLFIFLHQTKDLIKVVSVDTMIQIFSSAREVFVQGIKVRGARKAVVKLEEKCGAAKNAINSFVSQKFLLNNKTPM